jgi:hypothetical protein
MSPKIKVFNLIARVVCLIAAVGGSAAFACPGYYVTTGEDSSNVYATGIVYGADPGWGIQVTINLRNPPNTVSDNDDSGQEFSSYSTSANVQVAKGVVDGTYTATSQNYSIAWMGATPVWLGQVVEQKVVPPWIQIVRTSVAQPTMLRQIGANTFNTFVLPSINCSGSTTVSAGMTYPVSPVTMQVEIQDGSGTWVPSTATKTFTVTGGSQTVFSHSMRTSGGNTVPGTVTITGNFYSVPACAQKGPDPMSGYSQTSNTTVN